MRNKCLFALGVVFAMSLTSIVAFAFSFTGEPDVKNDQQQIVVVNPATESEETTSEQTVSAETEDTTATLQSAGSSLSGSMDWDAEDAYMLAKIAMAEAESEDTEGKALVMLVVLNRVWSDEFPDTIAGVIFQDGQFSPISNGRYDEVKPDADCYRALQLIQIDGYPIGEKNACMWGYSYNRYKKNRLILSVFAVELNPVTEDEFIGENHIDLDGYVCKEPVYRKTPLGREIADLLIAVNRAYGKSDYIPCITWGRNARFASTLEVGQRVQLQGRIQSREYVKKISEDNSERHTAYELSASRIVLSM